MLRFHISCAIFSLCVFQSWAVHAQEGATAANDRSCPGVTNEVTKSRELNRELNAYAGQTVPDELQQRVAKHLNLIAKLKAECAYVREQSAVKKQP